MAPLESSSGAVLAEKVPGTSILVSPPLLGLAPCSLLALNALCPGWQQLSSVEPCRWPEVRDENGGAEDPVQPRPLWGWRRNGAGAGVGTGLSDTISGIWGCRGVRGVVVL